MNCKNIRPIPEPPDDQSGFLAGCRKHYGFYGKDRACWINQGNSGKRAVPHENPKKTEYMYMSIKQENIVLPMCMTKNIFDSISTTMFCHDVFLHTFICELSI